MHYQFFKLFMNLIISFSTNLIDLYHVTSNKYHLMIFYVILKDLNNRLFNISI